tara:strand:- start:1868 stop:2524 length:657 start_codon:yes stop_codon:yes gene_type:complete
MSKEYLENLIKRNDYEKDNQNYLKIRVLKTFENLIKTFFNRNIYDLKNSLDLGSADGSFVKVLKEKGFNALGLDIKDLNFENDKFTQKDDTFDLITAISVIEHLSNPNNFLTEVKRVLKKDGFFILVTPNWKYDMKNFYNDPTHIKPYTTTSINFLLESFKFKNIKIVPWLVCKPSWMWKIPFSFELAKIIPFRGSRNKLIPEFLKGNSKSILIICQK